MKVLILGSNGMLAHAIKQVFSFSNIIPMTRDECDITNFNQVESHIKSLLPDLVINCAAYTNVEKAETEPALCEMVNATAVKNIANACLRNDSILIHFSTEMVFGQESTLPYKEMDEPRNPVNVYGKSKLKGERYIRQTWEKHYIVRTSWMFGPNGNNFVDKLLERASLDNMVDVVKDQLGCPTYTFDLARAVYELIADTSPFGIYHLVNEGMATRDRFAREIFDQASIECKINPVPSRNFLSIAKRPEFGILLNTKRKKLPRWTEALTEYLTGKCIINSF